MTQHVESGLPIGKVRKVPYLGRYLGKGGTDLEECYHDVQRHDAQYHYVQCHHVQYQCTVSNAQYHVDSAHGERRIIILGQYIVIIQYPTGLFALRSRP